MIVDEENTKNYFLTKDQSISRKASIGAIIYTIFIDLQSTVFSGISTIEFEYIEGQVWLDLTKT